MNPTYEYEGKMRSVSEISREMWKVSKLARVVALVKMVPEGKKVLDLGCGFGIVSKLLAGKSESVFAVDMLENNIKLAKTFNQEEGVEFVNCSAENLLARSDEKFGVIVITEVIEHVENPFELVKNCFDLLEPNGYLIVSTPDATGRLNILLNAIRGINGVEKEVRGLGTETDHIYVFDVRCLLRLLNVVGFSHVKHTFKGASVIMKVIK